MRLQSYVAGLGSASGKLATRFLASGWLSVTSAGMGCLLRRLGKGVRLWPSIETARRGSSCCGRSDEMKGVSVEIRLIRSEADYKVLLAEVSALIELDPDADSPEGERLEKLGLLVETYEARLYPVDVQSPSRPSNCACGKAR